MPDTATQPLSQGAALINGAVVPIAEAALPLTDWGFLHGDATYDVAHVWDGRFFRLEAHLARFARNCAALRYDRLPVAPDAIGPDLARLVRATGLERAYVAMIATRGTPAPGSRDPRSCTNRFLAFAVPFIWVATPEQQAAGLDVAISARRRIPPDSVDPRIKNYHWLDMTRALFDALESGRDSVLLSDGAGHVVEGPGFNVFARLEDGWRTPEDGVLDGVTRGTVCRIAEDMGTPVRRGPLAAAALRGAREVMLTTTAGGVIPVTRLDGGAVADGAPGPGTVAIREAYWALHDDPAWTVPVADLVG